MCSGNNILCTSIIYLNRGSNLWRPVGGRAVFGGQVAGQALVAAGKTKPEGVHVHSLHCYFIRPGQYCSSFL